MWLYVGMVATAAGTAWLAWVLLCPLLRQEQNAERAMPWWWRAAWPWIVAVAPLAGPLCAWRWRLRLNRAIARAALPPGVGYAHIARRCAVARLPLPAAWLKGLGTQRRRAIERDLPFVFDMMTLCVEAGLSVQGALHLAAQSGPPGVLRDALADALAEMRAGVSRTAAIKTLAERSNSPLARNWAAALAQAEALGASLGPVLRAQAAQCRSDRHTRAEQLAMQAPVKMLLPLIGCIFPCTFIVLAFPIAMQLLQSVQ
ncbi:type II secretion system F family protein [Achromobacter mucicolens]|uniref:type II secretion system F family protein n=1 Tax=Achromobacter mucicolens TaxID=1389922 RepID=UPI003207F64F